ncbi:hypothetical protein PhCBS80983_g03041 [Powellomyces hirtus]|uniref:Methylglutaconyl-CoA hydratase n=1 Tax=Powellomyces hirtus TaxID=109895 RepID=A0A507E437_9FUNG|nr:hypothetical protein PhCBS80983_g03041 [Powellomyces hirtus]
MFVPRVTLVSRQAVLAKSAPRAFMGTGRVLRQLHSTTTDAECSHERLTGADAGISIINFNRPKAKNALGRNFMKEFNQALQELRFDEDVRCVIVKSSVAGVFCAGADLKERTTMTPIEVAAFVHSLRTAFGNLESLPVPTIAALDGAALGGGLEVALSTDIRVAGVGAKLGLPETKLAIIPGAGGTQRLPRLIGIPRAKELIFTARVLKSVEAERIGLVNYAVEGSAYDKALEIARSILTKGPVAIKAAKLAIDRGTQVDISSGLAFEQTCYAQVIPTEDRLEGLRAFKEKREPVYKGR